jgi:hypothetical protein
LGTRTVFLLIPDASIDFRLTAELRVGHYGSDRGVVRLSLGSLYVAALSECLPIGDPGVAFRSG